ncbi:MAG: hypothetical protein OIF55_07580, partial [Amphritea sp.]|nr:hypothetical protein [Amphritea sp.]
KNKQCFRKYVITLLYFMDITMSGCQWFVCLLIGVLGRADCYGQFEPITLFYELTVNKSRETGWLG